MNDVFKAPEITVSDIKSELGLVGARAILSLLVSEAVLFFNVGKTMNDSQIALTCDLLIEAYPHFKPEDFKLCFRNAMKLKYGTIYDRIDGSVIIGWLRVYEQERIDCAIADSENEAKQAKADMDAGSYYTDYIEGLKSRALCGDEAAERALAVHMNTDSLIKQLEDERKGNFKVKK